MSTEMDGVEQAKQRLYAALLAHKEDGVSDPTGHSLDDVVNDIILTFARAPENIKVQFADVLDAARDANNALHAAYPEKYQGMVDFDGAMRFWSSPNVLPPIVINTSQEQKDS